MEYLKRRWGSRRGLVRLNEKGRDKEDGRVFAQSIKSSSCSVRIDEEKRSKDHILETNVA
jgi:hypothetical protein